VLYPGREASEAGPDFRDALLYQEGLGLVRGDVELHLRQEDWRNHGHHRDPLYGGVILHGVLQGQEADTRLPSGTAAPVVSLEPLLHPQERPNPYVSWKESPLWALLRQQGVHPPQDRCQAGNLLDQAGMARFRHRSKGFVILLGEEPPEEVLYQGLMECMGYSENRQAFLELAHRVPYHALEGLALRASPESLQALISQRLLEAAGFLPVGSGAIKKRSPMPFSRWRLFRVRPGNHPRRRIDGMAHLLGRYWPSGFIPSLAALVLQGSWGELEKGLTVSSQGQGPALIGRARARDAAVNVVLPFFHAWATLQPLPQLSSMALGLFKGSPPLQPNRLTREMERCLFPHLWLPLATNAARQQGLTHLHHLVAGEGQADYDSIDS